MGRLQQEKKKQKLTSTLQRMMGYIDPKFYPEAGATIIVYDDSVKAKVFKTYENHIDMTKVTVNPYRIYLDGFNLRIHQRDDVTIADLYITKKYQGRVVLHFGDVLMLNWNKNEIIESDNLLVSNITESVEDFVSLAQLNEIIIFSLLAVNKNLSDIIEKGKKQKKSEVSRTNINIDVNLDAKTDEEEKDENAEAERKDPEYVTESWKVSGYERNDGTVVSDYVSNRNPELLKKTDEDQ